MKRLIVAVLACVAATIVAGAGLCADVAPRMENIPVRWTTYGPTGPTGTPVDTAFFNGADATDTTGVIDLQKIMGSELNGATLAAAVPMFRIHLVGEAAADIDSIYYNVDGSLDGNKWHLGGTAGNYTHSVLPVTATAEHISWIISADPDALTSANIAYLMPKIRIRIKLDDGSGNRLASTKCYVTAWAHRSD